MFVFIYLTLLADLWSRRDTPISGLFYLAQQYLCTFSRGLENCGKNNLTSYPEILIINGWVNSARFEGSAVFQRKLMPEWQLKMSLLQAMGLGLVGLSQIDVLILFLVCTVQWCYFYIYRFIQLKIMSILIFSPCFSMLLSYGR